MKLHVSHISALLALSCAMVCIETTHATAQTAPRVRALTGRIIESGLDDYGVPNITVTVEGTTLSVTTNDEGMFTLEGLPEHASALTIVCHGEDYAPTRAIVALPEVEHSDPVLIEMAWEGEPTEVVETRTRSWRDVEHTSNTRLTTREIQAAPVRNAEEILRQVPGITLVQHGSEGKGYQYFLRGFDAIHGSDLELTVDDMPINEWSNIHAQGYLDLGLIIPEMVERVDVTKGPFRLDQGAFAMAGSAHYRLGVDADVRGTRTAYTYGTTGRHRLFASHASQNQPDDFIGVEATRDEGFGMRRGIERVSINARKRLLGAPADRLKLNVTALGSAARFELPGPLRQEDIQAGRVDFYDTYDQSSRGEAARTLLALDLLTHGDRQYATTKLYVGYRHLDLLENFTGFLLDPAHGDRRNQRQSTWSYGLINNFSRELGEHLNLKLGFGLRADRISQSEDQIGQNLELRDTRRALTATQIISHGLAGLQWRPTRTLSLDVGTRLDLVHLNTTDELIDLPTSRQDTLTTLSPRLNARWSAQENLDLVVAYGQGYRPPEARAFSSFEASRNGLSEDLYEGGDPRVTTSHAVEIGTAWRPSQRWTAKLSGFGTWIGRESVFDHVSGTSLELQGTRRLGAELDLEVSPLDWLTLGADATIVDARFLESGNPVPFAPWLVSGFRAIATHPSGWRAGFRTLHVAPRTLPHGARGTTLLRHDATAGYQWKALRVGLEIENLLNSNLREGEYHYASHWQQGQPTSQLPVLHTTAGPPLNARLTLGAQF